MYDVEWPDGTVETNIPARMLEGVKKTEHADESAMGQHEAHGVEGHRIDSAINERKYKKRKSKKKVDYKKAYKKYHSSKKAKKERAQRNAAGRLIKDQLGIKVPKGYEIDHKTPISKGGSNNIKNLRIIKRKANRQGGQELTSNIRRKNKKKKGKY